MKLPPRTCHLADAVFVHDGVRVDAALLRGREARVHALLQLLSGHGQALAVDAKEVQRVLYGLLARASLVSQPSMLATALDCVEHLCKRDRASLLAPRAASIVRRLLSLASTSPPGCAIALLCAASRLLVSKIQVAAKDASDVGRRCSKLL